MSSSHCVWNSFFARLPLASRSYQLVLLRLTTCLLALPRLPFVLLRANSHYCVPARSGCRTAVYKNWSFCVTGHGVCQKPHLSSFSCSSVKLAIPFLVAASLSASGDPGTEAPEHAESMSSCSVNTGDSSACRGDGVLVVTLCFAFAFRNFFNC